MSTKPFKCSFVMTLIINFTPKNTKFGKSDIFKSLEIAKSHFISIPLINILSLLIKRSQFKLKKH